MHWTRVTFEKYRMYRLSFWVINHVNTTFIVDHNNASWLHELYSSLGQDPLDSAGDLSISPVLHVFTSHCNTHASNCVNGSTWQCVCILCVHTCSSLYTVIVYLPIVYFHSSCTQCHMCAHTQTHQHTLTHAHTHTHTHMHSHSQTHTHTHYAHLHIIVNVCSIVPTLNGCIKWTRQENGYFFRDLRIDDALSLFAGSRRGRRGKFLFGNLRRGHGSLLILTKLVAEKLLRCLRMHLS